MERDLLEVLLSDREWANEKLKRTSPGSDEFKALSAHISALTDDISSLQEAMAKAAEAEEQLSIERDKAEVDRDRAIEESRQHHIENELEKKRQKHQLIIGVGVPVVMGVLTILATNDQMHKFLKFSETNTVCEKDTWKFFSPLRLKQ